MGGIGTRSPWYLLKEKTRHGKTVWYVRIEDGPRFRVHGVFGTSEFKRNHKAVLATALGGGAPAPRAVTKAASARESLRWLWDKYLESPVWKELGTATHRQRVNIMKHVLAKVGDERYDALDLVASRDARTSSQGRNFLDAVRGMYRWAAHKDVRLIESDPSKDIENPPRTETEGFLPWTEEDVAQYQAHYPLGTKERVWLDMMLYTGPRRGDVWKLGKQHLRVIPDPETKLPKKVIVFKTEKRNKKNKAQIEVTIPILPILQQTLDAGPCGEMTFIVGAHGRPYKSKESFGNAFSKAAQTAGLVMKSAHGVRKIAATTAANNGATTHELMALFGWTTVEMAERYTRSAARARLSVRAGNKLEREETGAANPAPRNVMPMVRGMKAK